LKDRNADIEDYNSQRKVGRCPNPEHNDSTPSFSYDPKRYEFHCFGCGYKVDILDAYILKGGCTFIEACQKLFAEADMQYDFTEKGLKGSRQYRYPEPKYADNKDKVYEYWATRHISKETIDYLNIQQDERGNTLFQYYDLNDVLVTVKVRPSRLVPKGENKIWFLSDENKKTYDSTNILYNINKINTSAPLIITSGEGDCAAAVECGFLNTVSINGGDGNLQWIAECWDFLQNFEHIIVVHDNDKSGEKFKKEVSTRLGEYRVKNVEIPLVHMNEDGSKTRIKDLNELLFYEGKAAVIEAITNARDTEIESVVDYTEVKDFDMTDADGFQLGIGEFDYHIGKFYEGSTTILTGITGSGKSSLLSTIICQSVDQGFPCWVYRGELDNSSLKSWVKSVHAGQRNVNEYRNALNQNYYRVKPEALNAINKYYKGQLWFYKDSFDPMADKLLKTMEAMVRMKGVKTFIIDNLTVVGLDCDDKNKYIKQEEFIRSVIDFAKKWHVICILVLHPRKMDTVRRMNLFDLQGVTASANLAHRVISLYRVQPKEKEGIRNSKGGYKVEPIKYDVILDILKDRYGSSTGQPIGLYYDKPSKRFFTNEQDLDTKYKWDTNNYDGIALPFGIPQFQEEDEVYGRIGEST